MSEKSETKKDVPEPNVPPKPAPPKMVAPQPFQGNSPYVSNYARGPQQINSLAIVSLVLGLVGIFSGGIASIPAVICGHLALNQIKKNHEDGSQLAKTGLICGYVVIGLWVLVLLTAIVLLILAVTVGVGLDLSGVTDGTMAMGFTQV